MYADDYDGYMPYRGYSIDNVSPKVNLTWYNYLNGDDNAGGILIDWMELTDNRGKTYSVFSGCPSWFRFAFWGTGDLTNLWLSSRSYGQVRKIEGTEYGRYRIDSGGTLTHDQALFKLASAIDPENTMACGDSVSTELYRYSRLSGGCIIHAATFSAWYGANTPYQADPTRHGGRNANYLFLDMHAESLEPEPAFDIMIEHN